MKKKISILIVVIVMMSIFTVRTYAQETYTLTLDQAIEMAVKDNPQLISADTKISDAEKQLSDAKYEQKKQKGFIRLPEGFALVAVKKGYYVEQAKTGVESAKLEKTQAECKIAYDVTQKYYNVKLAEALCASANDAYNLAVENKNHIDSRYALGLAADIDVANAAYAVNQAKSAYDNYSRNYDLARRSLLIALQIEDEDVTFNLTDTIEYVDFSSDIDADIAKAMTSRYDVYNLEQAVLLAKKYRDVTVVLGGKSPEYSAANSSVVQCDYNCTNSKKLIGLSIRSSYNDILNAKDKLILQEENLSLREKEYEIAQTQYDLGMITNVELTSVRNSVTTAQIELNNSKLTYKLAVARYGYEVAIGL